MRRVVAVLVVLLLAASAPTAGRQPTDTLSRRLAALGRVWLAVKFGHPRVALSDRDWDSVLATAVPAVKAAKDDAAFEAAVGAMLATLDDPVTRVQNGPDGNAMMGGMPKPLRPIFTALPDGALLVDVRAPGALADPALVREAVTANLEAIARADRLVVDLRGSRRSGWQAARAFEAIGEVLVSEPTMVPSARVVRHAGYRSQGGGASFYVSEMVTEAASMVMPRPNLSKRRVAFLADREAMIPPLALALQAAGLGAILSAGDSIVTPVQTLVEPLGPRAMAIVRVSDLVLGTRRLEAAVDETFAPKAGDAALHARAAQRVSAPGPARGGIEDPGPRWRPEKTYDSPAYPDEAHRLLAVYRLWGIIDHFLPYAPLMDQPWDRALTIFIPRLLEARDELEYARAIAAMAALTQDSHVRVSGSQALAKFVGEVAAPVQVRYVEQRPIVTRVLDPSSAPGLKAGDEVLTVDGVEIAAIAARIERHITYSTPASRSWQVASRLLSGDAGSVAKVGVRGADGGVREVQVTRPAKPTPSTQRDGEVYRIVDGNIGYADLERLEVAQVPAMFEAFRGTNGIVFDMRGYPRGTAWSIAPRINTRKSTAAALFYRPVVAAGSKVERISFMQDLPPTTTWVYDRPTVMLIDERAISQSEHSGLFYKAANGTTFVGSPTTGANGDVTVMTLPGGLRVSFTGHDVRWPDGKQLQRVGLQPDVPVTPTIAGIRAGKDEVLDAALAFLASTGKS